MDGPEVHIENFVHDLHGGLELFGGGEDEAVHAVFDHVSLLADHVNAVMHGHIVEDVRLLGLCVENLAELVITHIHSIRKMYIFQFLRGLQRFD